MDLERFDEQVTVIESERVLGVATEQTVAPFAPAHLRHATIEGIANPRVANFKLSRLVPYDPTDAEMRSIRYQEGYNHFASPWVDSVNTRDWCDTPTNRAGKWSKWGTNTTSSIA